MRLRQGEIVEVLRNIEKIQRAKLLKAVSCFETQELITVNDLSKKIKLSISSTQKLVNTLMDLNILKEERYEQFGFSPKDDVKVDIFYRVSSYYVRGNR